MKKKRNQKRALKSNSKNLTTMNNDMAAAANIGNSVMFAEPTITTEITAFKCDAYENTPGFSNNTTT